MKVHHVALGLAWAVCAVMVSAQDSDAKPGPSPFAEVTRPVSTHSAVSKATQTLSSDSTTETPASDASTEDNTESTDVSESSTQSSSEEEESSDSSSSTETSSTEVSSTETTTTTPFAPFTADSPASIFMDHAYAQVFAGIIVVSLSLATLY
ncbi:hypothetical protein H4R34_000928 [Dimargaris verticillata]|uniref:Uncharacterized protein n=1 Tax=Dimargaris verticillata TaxID=2761393 RepID=A0A9W8EAT5_9FUNG|nr:hypothetical protein H4R34_000928 [Dimargaris verticillata]